MRSRHLTLDFVEKCRAAERVEQIGELLIGELNALGVEYVALASHVDPLNPPKGAVTIVNYPVQWVARFSEQDYQRRDPIFWKAGWSTRLFFWDDLLEGDLLTLDQRRILKEAGECGLVNGFTIPIHAPGAIPASCSMVPYGDGIDPLHMPDIYFMVLNAHQEARSHVGANIQPPPILSKRQRQCLALVGQGKSDFVIGAILGISPRTVEHTIEGARRKFGVSHRTQAAMLAVMHGLVTEADLAD